MIGSPIWWLSGFKGNFRVDVGFLRPNTFWSWRSVARMVSDTVDLEGPTTIGTETVPTYFGDENRF